MARRKKDFMFAEDSLEYIEKVKEERHLKYPSEALEVIIREHREDETLSIEERAKFLAKEIALEFSKELTGIKYSSREADKNSKIILELLNGIYIKQDLGNILPSKSLESEALKNMREYIEEGISNKRTTKLYKGY